MKELWARTDVRTDGRTDGRTDVRTDTFEIDFKDFPGPSGGEFKNWRGILTTGAWAEVVILCFRLFAQM